MNPPLQEIQSIVAASLIQLRIDLGLPGPEEISRETRLYGGGSDLDSMAIVHLIVDIEARLHQAYGKSWILADERALSRNRSPFRSIGSLCEFIQSLTPEAS